MGDELRKSGIDIIGDVPWATHFCQFYRTKADLLDILVPYFKAGLENNEFCMWVTAEPLTSEQARRALNRAVPGLAGYITSGQIEIIPYTDWYVKDGVFSQGRVLDGWVEKLNQALAKGFDGLRLTGNTFWLERKDWRSFAEYEATVDNVIGKYRMLALCTYSLNKCGAAEVIDVVRNHEFALVKQEGGWEMVERSAYKQAIAESQEKFQRIVRTAIDGFWLCDLQGRLLEVNDSFCALSGYSREELLGMTILDVLPEERRGEGSLRARQVMKMGQARFEDEYQRRDGGIIDVEVSVNFMSEAGGRFFVFMRDITERKQAEIKLKEAADQWRATFDSIGDMISIHDRDFRVIRANRTFLDAVGMKAHEAEGKFCYELVHNTGMPIFNCPHVQTLKSEKTVTEEVFEPALGKYLEVTTSPVFDQGKVTGSVHIARDISARKKTEQEIKQLNETLRRRNADLEASNKELESFSYSVSHDLRAPLRSMEGFSEALMEDYGNGLDAQGKDYLKRIQRSSRLMAELIDDILQLSRLTRSEMRPEELDLSGMAQSIVANLRRSQPERQVEFVASPGLVAHGDRKLIQVVLENLISNAWKFSSRKQGAKIEFGAAWRDGKQAYFVRDNGAGFDMKYVGKLFGAFQRLHSNADFPGNGIGLATVQRVIHRHGGQVWAEGEVGNGATFYFTLD